MKSRKYFGLALATISKWRFCNSDNFFNKKRQENILLAIDTLKKNGVSPDEWALSDLDRRCLELTTSIPFDKLPERWQLDSLFLLKNNIDLNKLNKILRGEK